MYKKMGGIKWGQEATATSFSVKPQKKKLQGVINNRYC